MVTKRKFCIIRKYSLSWSKKETYIYFDDLDKPINTSGQYGYGLNLDFIRVPFTMLELVNVLGLKVFYNKSEFLFDKDNNLLSIKCGDSFLLVKPKRSEFSSTTQREINRLMKQFE